MDVTAAILAGGLGTRLESVVKERPKVLAEIKGRPFLAYLLDQLAAVFVQEIVLCTGFLGDQVRMLFGDSYKGVRLLYSQESKALGTAGALRLALPLFKSDPVLIMNGDSFCDFDVGDFLVWQRIRNAKAMLALVRVFDTGRYGEVHVNKNGVVSSFAEKGPSGNPGWINAGIYMLARSLITSIPPGRAVSLEREIFPAWIGKGLYGYQCKARFLDIGTPESYAAAEQFFYPKTQS